MKIKIHCAKTKGKREYMEDFISVRHNDEYLISSIFDGHGGGKCSSFLFEQFHVQFHFFLSKKPNTIPDALQQTTEYLQQVILNKNYLVGQLQTFLYLIKTNLKYMCLMLVIPELFPNITTTLHRLQLTMTHKMKKKKKRFKNAVV